MTFCAGGFSSTVKKLPSKGPAFRPARSFRPGQQHLPIHVRRNGRMLALVAIARRSNRGEGLSETGSIESR